VWQWGWGAGDGSHSRTSHVTQGDESKLRPVPKLWEKGATPRNEYAQTVEDSLSHYEFFEV